MNRETETGGIVWGRAASGAVGSSAMKKRKGRLFFVTDVVALICALICALSLCAFCAGGGTAASAVEAVSTVSETNEETTARVTYTPPEKREEWSFWDYFADLCAGVLGYGEA